VYQYLTVWVAQETHIFYVDFRVGERVGARVGAEGATLGFGVVGAALDLEGARVGVVGVRVGVVGFRVGVVGFRVGAVGYLVGTRVDGLNVGAKDGLTDGLMVGAKDGRAVGRVGGRVDGATVGNTVGLKAGFICTMNAWFVSLTTAASASGVVADDTAALAFCCLITPSFLTCPPVVITLVVCKPLAKTPLE